MTPPRLNDLKWATRGNFQKESKWIQLLDSEILIDRARPFNLFVKNLVPRFVWLHPNIQNICPILSFAILAILATEDLADSSARSVRLGVRRLNLGLEKWRNSADILLFGGSIVFHWRMIVCISWMDKTITKSHESLNDNIIQYKGYK